MSLVECAKCGLVSFHTVTHCKRCGQLMSGVSEFVEQPLYRTNVERPRAYQTQPLYQNRPSPYQNFQTPPPPPTFYGNQPPQFHQPPTMPMFCVKCGGSQNTNLQSFKKEYVPPVAYLGLLIGLIPGAILIAVLRTMHHINAPFCAECWKKFRRVTVVETLSALSFFVGVMIAVVFAIAFNSVFVFFLFCAATIGVIIWGQIYKSQSSPKYKSVDSRQVVINSPVVGDMSFVK